ncbi:MAG: tetratricopeptide repeat protein [Candidatus Hodarchaeota archaeon]
MILISLKEYYGLLDRGKIDEAFILASQMKSEAQCEAELMLTLILLNITGLNDQVTQLLEKNLLRSQRHPYLRTLALAAQAWVALWQADYGEATSKLDSAIELFTSLPQITQSEKPHIQALLLFLEGSFLQLMKDVDKGDHVLDIYNRVLVITESENFPFRLLSTVAWNNIAVIYEARGDWEQANLFHNKIITRSQELENEENQVYSLLKLGRFAHYQGDLEGARDLVQKSITLSEQINNRRALASGLEKLGTIQVSEGNFQEALRNYMRSYEITKQIQLHGVSDLAFILHKIVLLYLDMDSYENAKKYLDLLQEHTLRDTSTESQTISLISEALLLKISQYFKNKARAQEILRKIVESDHARERYRFLALLHLSDLLIQEAKLSNDHSSFVNAQAMIEQANARAQSWNFLPDRINALILEARVSLIKGDLQNASRILDTAKVITMEKGLKFLTDQVDSEQNILKSEITKWQELLARNASLQERIASAEIETYLKEAIELCNQQIGT